MSDAIDQQIDELRRRIDELDLSILELLNKRATCALEIGAAKRSRGQAIFDAVRETLILQRVRAANSGPMQGEGVRRTFERILDESRRLERIANDTAKPQSERGKA